MSRHADEATVRRWFDAFNSRNLEGMLDCMDARVDFRPLRLGGIDAVYHCHVGVRDWFASMAEMEHRHQIVLSKVHTSSRGEVIAAGALSAEHGAPSSFWAVEQLEGGLIVSARHLLSERFHLR